MSEYEVTDVRAEGATSKEADEKSRKVVCNSAGHLLFDHIGTSLASINDCEGRKLHILATAIHSNFLFIVLAEGVPL